MDETGGWHWRTAVHPGSGWTLLALAALLSGLASIGPLTGTSHAAQPMVVDARLGVHPDKTRFVLDYRGDIEYRVFALADPYRVVIDLPEMAHGIQSKRFGLPGGMVSGFRFGLFQQGTSRVVLDITMPVTIAANFVLPGQGDKPNRLVLDLKPAKRAAFIAALKPPPPLPSAKPAPPRPKAPPVGDLPKPVGGKHVVAIDPGHGGVDPGAVGRDGFREKNLTLEYAREVKRTFEATGRYKVVLTRDRDVFLRLRERVGVSRRAGAELFISLHADTIKNRKVRGASVYTLSEKASDKEAAALADKENKADIIAGVDLNNESPEVSNILIDLAQRETMNLSAQYAGRLIGHLAKEVRVLKRGHRFAGFAVLKAPDVPSVLIELGYLSNRSEEKLLRSKVHRRKIGEILLRATDEYFSRVDTLTRS